MLGLWDFSVAVYGRPGVSQACLQLQDDYRVDVPLLLFALWAGHHRGVTLAPAEIAEIDKDISAWRDRVIRPIRDIRRLLKSDTLGMDADATERFRSRVKKLELESEGLEIALLETRLPSRSDDGASAYANLRATFETTAQRGWDANAQHLLQTVCDGIGQPDSQTP